MKIDMPSEGEIRVQIDNIVAQGLERRESFYYYLKNMYRQIGIRYLFRDGLEIISIILLVSSILISVLTNSYMEEIEEVYAYLFTISPILYLAMSIFSFINAKQNKTYEVEMACKYNIYQISAFRMLVFSVVCILFNCLFVYIMAYFYEDINYLKAFIVSIASLFLFSTVFLFAITRINNVSTKYFTVLGWIFINLALYLFKVDFYIQLLNSISIYTWIVVVIVSIFVYLKKLKWLIVFRNIEGVV